MRCGRWLGCAAAVFAWSLPSAALAASETDNISAQHMPSTQDLDFLLGEWKVERVYQPGAEQERSATGSLICEDALQNTYIRCTYFFERPDSGPIHDVVFFNYNPIYEQYEALWLSATWPVKVTMRASKDGPFEDRTIDWEASFLIEGGVTEWVRSAWALNGQDGFTRRTDIRTSRHPDGQWTHWMNEKVFRD